MDQKISQEELNKLKELALSVKVANLTSENANLTYQVYLQSIYIKYGLSSIDKINESTGDFIKGNNE